MTLSKGKLALLGLATGLLGACSAGYGSRYGGVSIGSAGYHGDPYYSSGYYDRRDSYYGWHGDYYYPGTGYYVYDRQRRAHRWNDSQRRYWQARRQNVREVRENWRAFRREAHSDYRRDRRRDYRQDRGEYRRDQRADRREWRRDRRDDRRERRRGRDD